ncbi:MAG: RagB/SusD family nutrient uptake outer membrane protein [Segetibacter sp.]|nr:RagB/SusD family nutrient uptake outer membrane protein [Segetibacter sp.]
MNRLYFLFFVVFALAMASCEKGNFLDTKTTVDLNKEIVFADSANTMDYLSGLYVDLSLGFTLSSDNSGYDYAKMCDEAEGRYPALGNYDKVVTQGTFSGSFFSTIAGQWANFYQNIQNANILLAEVDKSPLSAGKKTRTKAEARFLRAYHYHNLMKYFGGVPLIGDKVFSATDRDESARSTYEECVNYVVSELDAIANDLPPNYSGLDYGRITKGACLALKSRVLLYAASPLYNGGSTATGELIKYTAYPDANQNRWEKAALAAKAVMNLNEYSLNIDNTTKPGSGFYKLFISRVNNEFILPRPLPPGKQLEQAFNPRSRGGANFYYYPTQELVDMFPTINGKPITDDLKTAGNPTGYDAANPYVNRDPRFESTVIYNGSLFYLNADRALREVNTFKGPGATTDAIISTTGNTSTSTGYFVRKLQDELAAFTGGGNVNRSLPIIRYGEILLNYAEATNEMGNTAEAITTLKLLRERAGINAGADGLFGLPATTTVAGMKKIIQNERAVELAFENHRFWDVRRWKIGSLIDGKNMHGMEITNTGTATAKVYTYKRVDVTKRYFKDIYYYFPIPKNDVIINPNLTQNPGY